MAFKNGSVLDRAIGLDRRLHYYDASDAHPPRLRGIRRFDSMLEYRYLEVCDSRGLRTLGY
jgi:hypothetical protein